MIAAYSLIAVFLTASLWVWGEERKEKNRRRVEQIRKQLEDKRTEDRKFYQGLDPQSRAGYDAWRKKIPTNEQYLEGIHPKYKNYDFMKEN